MNPTTAPRAAATPTRSVLQRTGHDLDRLAQLARMALSYDDVDRERHCDNVLALIASQLEQHRGALVALEGLTR